MKSEGLWAGPPPLCTLLVALGKDLFSAPLAPVLLGIFENYVQNLVENHSASRLLL